MARLRGSGYEPYYLYRQKNMAGGFENVGWAMPGTENLYNICIMEELCSIIAMGAGGSTKLISADGRQHKALHRTQIPPGIHKRRPRLCRREGKDR